MCMKVVLVVRLASDIVRRTGRMKMVLSCSSYLNKREEGKDVRGKRLKDIRLALV